MRRLVLTLCVWSASWVGAARAEGAAGVQAQTESLPPAQHLPQDSTPTWAPPAAPLSGPYSYSAARFAAERELVQVDQELARLRSQRPGVAFPVLLLIGGYTVATVSGLLSLAFWADAREYRYRTDERGNRYRYRSTDDELLPPVRGTAVLMGLGLVAGSVAMMLLVPRVRTRRALRRVMTTLQERRRQLVQQLTLSWAMSADRGALGWSARLQF